MIKIFYQVFGYATLIKNRDKVYKHFFIYKIECRPVICGNIYTVIFGKKIIKKRNILPKTDIIHKYRIYLQIMLIKQKKILNLYVKSLKK